MAAIRTAVWPYLREDIYHVVWSLMELSLMVPLLYALMPWARYWPPLILFALLFAFMLIPLNLIRVMSLASVSLPIQRRVLLAGMILSVILSLRLLIYSPAPFFDLNWLFNLFEHLTASGYPLWARDIGVIGFTLFAWYRGIRLAMRTPTTYSIGLQFRILALLAAPIIIFIGRSRITGSITPYILLFCLSGLAMIALARADEVERSTSGMSFPITPRWLLAVLTAAFLVVLAGVFFASTVADEIVVSGPQTAVIFAALAIFYTLVNLVGPTLFVLFEWLAAILLVLLRPLAQAISDFSGLELFGDPVGEAQEVEVSSFLDEVGVDLSLLPPLIFVIFLAAIILIISLALRRMYSQQVARPISDAQQDNGGNLMAEEETLWQKLKSNLSMFNKNWRRALSVRRIYRQMVALGTAQGFPRRVSQTPYEYLSHLAEAWPDSTAESRIITEAYVRVRYGELPETKAELDRITNAWQKLESDNQFQEYHSSNQP